jgi:hypothetical protein
MKIKDVNIVISFLGYLAYFMADYQERLYEESLIFLNTEHHIGISLNVSQTDSNINATNASENENKTCSEYIL